MRQLIKRRLLAAMIDMALILLMIYFYAIAYNGFVEYTNLSVKIYHILFIIYGYFITQEFIFKTTIGKRMNRIRVGFEEQNLKNLTQIVLRNSFIIFEIFVPFIYLIPILINNNKIGDFFSKIKLIYD
ncbi:RDD family protein [Aquimarina sp. Aq107]|uniref:RDD family protein n=1 Tax=Aquimarina sp. Aq107 TaxID=1191912 RepID=UPI000D55F627|nr:RDD family protein [Aquimarina sp. Aq107]